MSPEPESLLALDFGHTYAKATLVDRVGGAHRFVACGLAPQVQPLSPAGEPPSLQACLDDLEAVSGRQVSDGDGQLMLPERFGAGVDAVGGVVSSLEPLRVALCYLHEDDSLQFAEAALRSAPVMTVARISGTQVSARGEDFGRFAQAVRDQRLHALLLVGGGDRKPDRAVVGMAEALALAATLLRSQQRPLLLYAGPAALRPAVIGAVGEKMAARMVDNPAADGKSAFLGPLREELALLHLTTMGEQAAGMQPFWDACDGRVVSVGQAMLNAYSQRGVDVLAADVGAGDTVLVRTSLSQVLVEQGCGVGQGAAGLVRRLGVPAIQRWTTGNDDDVAVAVRDWVSDRRVRPWIRATSPTEAEVELGCVREALRAALQSAAEAWPEGREYPAPLPPRVDMVVGSGAALRSSRGLPQAALALIDGLQPVGACRLALDRDNLGTSLGALAELNPQAVLSVLERDGLLVLGTLIAPVGQVRQGREAVRVTLSAADGESGELRVEGGDILRLPLAPGMTGQAVVKPARGLDVGAGPGQGLELQVEGGPLGLLIDARGRPLPDITGLDDRRALLRRWLAALEAL